MCLLPRSSEIKRVSSLLIASFLSKHNGFFYCSHSIAHFLSFFLTFSNKFQFSNNCELDNPMLAGKRVIKDFPCVL